MKKVLFGIVGFLVVSIFTGVDARSIRREERPVQYAYMNKDNSTYGFVSAENLVLTLTQLDGANNPTGVRLNYHDSKTGAFHADVLEIVDVSKDACGSTIYQAQLSLPHIALTGTTVNVMPVPTNYRRLNITLKDHTTRLCDDVIANLWEAHVREGFGWCGTMDSTMDLSGQPQSINNIQ